VDAERVERAQAIAFDVTIVEERVAIEARWFEAERIMVALARLSGSRLSIGSLGLTQDEVRDLLGSLRILTGNQELIAKLQADINAARDELHRQHELGNA
jgi:hypothetical protein